MMASLRTLLLLGVVVLPTIFAKSCKPPFKSLLGRWCILVEVTAPSEGYGEPVTWTQAREGCRESGADLISVDSHDKMQGIVYHLAKELPAETEDGFVYWVGGTHIGEGNWQWVKTSSPIEMNHLWVPSEPSTTSGTHYTKLVPADTEHGRHYLISNPASQVSPAYICEQ